MELSSVSFLSRRPDEFQILLLQGFDDKERFEFLSLNL
jgi:hypothetical protein